ncbi:response regulator [Paenibacillus sp. GCM10012303]|uniref:response regulator n=1 Tax=Paenibacillus sp. GCM10012303 TaxID=3317340 RepID=UPI003621827A
MPYTILIVDDEPDIVKLLYNFFKKNGYNPLTAANGAEAIRQAEKQPDLILLDIHMPEPDGLQVCERIRSHVACPILFLTAKVEDADKPLKRNGSMNGYGGGRGWQRFGRRRAYPQAAGQADRGRSALSDRNRLAG